MRKGAISPPHIDSSMADGASALFRSDFRSEKGALSPRRRWSEGNWRFGAYPRRSLVKHRHLSRITQRGGIG
jgi:hypothetical protein